MVWKLVTGKCVVPDGMQLLYPRLAVADGIVLGSPVYIYKCHGLHEGLYRPVLLLGG